MELAHAHGVGAFPSQTRVAPIRCLGFIPRWQIIRGNASHVAELHYQTNTNHMVYYRHICRDRHEKWCYSPEFSQA